MSKNRRQRLQRTITGALIITLGKYFKAPHYCLLILLSLAGNAHANCSSLDAIDWLLGDWQTSQMNNKITTESWWQVSDYSFEGLGQSLHDGAIKSSESLRLVEMSDAVFYIAKVTHNPMPIAFQLTTCTREEATFENPEHDFPKRIEYSLINAQTIQVYVSDGANKGFTLNFTRVEQN